MASTDHLLTLGEVANSTRLSVKTIRRATQRGDLPAVRLGRSIRIRPGDLELFISRHTSEVRVEQGEGS